jgi:hypothetical protein
MAVPNTTTFTLQDVVNEISPSSNDLATCAVQANPRGFDVNYHTYPVTSLLEFRNYSHVVKRILLGASSGSGAGACALIADTQYWHNGLFDYPNNGDVIYTDSAGQNPFNGGNAYYKQENNYSILIGTNGQVTSRTIC